MSTVDEVKQRLDIVDVVSGYVPLARSGRNLKAVCPFHEEKTPSFFVFPDRQSWRCFGCGAGGDVISFVMKREGTDFNEALRMLADRAGVILGREKRGAEEGLIGRILEVNEAAARYFHNALLKDRAAGFARDYVKRRKIADSAVVDFELGFSPEQGLRRHLEERGFSEEEITGAGLLRQREGRAYELFRNRLMFPIRDIKGRVVGFGARALDDSQPKYLNSPQTAVFDKSAVLYAIDRARSSIRETKLVVIVEGYMDVIAAHQQGMANVVGSMGTSLTERQIKLLKPLARTLAFALDPDVAGSAATLRGIDVARRSLDREQVSVPGILGTTTRLKADMRIISLPQGKDPDALIREDPEEWQRLVDNALPLVDHLIAVVSSRLDLTGPEGKSQAIEQLLPVIAELDDAVQREFYLGKLASLLGIAERRLAEIAASMHRPRKRADRAPQADVPSYGDRLEERCLSLLLQHPELRARACSLPLEHFERSENREIYSAWSQCEHPDELRDKVGSGLLEHLESLCRRKLPPGGEKERESDLAACIRRLEERKLRLQEEFLTSEVISRVVDGEELNAEMLAALQRQSAEINSQLVKNMQESASTSLVVREEQ